MKTIGKCINFGLCDRADSRELISGDSPECPECQKPLQPVTSGGGPGLLSRLPNLGKGALVAIVLASVSMAGIWWASAASGADPEKADLVISEYYPNLQSK